MNNNMNNNMNNIDYYVDCNNYECKVIINNDLNQISNNYIFIYIFNYIKIFTLFAFTFILSYVYVAINIYYPSVKHFEILYNNNKEYYDYDSFFFECLNILQDLRFPDVLLPSSTFRGLSIMSQFDRRFRRIAAFR